MRKSGFLPKWQKHRSSIPGKTKDRGPPTGAVNKPELRSRPAAVFPEHALTKTAEYIKRAYIARGAVSAERMRSNPMNLIRVMPAKGSGLLGTGGSEHDEWSQAAFPQ
jgi:hypothetical protein